MSWWRAFARVWEVIFRRQGGTPTAVSEPASRNSLNRGWVGGEKVCLHMADRTPHFYLLLSSLLFLPSRVSFFSVYIVRTTTNKRALRSRSGLFPLNISSLQKNIM